MDIRGIVRSSDGGPIEGVLVMGTDLNYAETDAAGRFSLAAPEAALFFWCTGYIPHARSLPVPGESLEVMLQPMTALAAPKHAEN